MNPTPEYVALVQREREIHLAQARLARVATCVRACCNPTLTDRLARALRLPAATC